MARARFTVTMTDEQAEEIRKGLRVQVDKIAEQWFDQIYHRDVKAALTAMVIEQAKDLLDDYEAAVKAADKMGDELRDLMVDSNADALDALNAYRAARARLP